MVVMVVVGVGVRGEVGSVRERGGGAPTTRSEVGTRGATGCMWCNEYFFFFFFFFFLVQ